MKQLSSNELRALFLKFFQKKGHSVIPSASVIPENDPTVLFTTAGMHPLVPYLLGQKHPQGTRLTDVQKCIRTGDIDEVGDMSHLTFFEMLGNWSLGDYFKDQMIPWSWEFLTSPEWLGIDPDKLAFTVFEGDEDCPRDEEAANLWRKCGVKDDHLFYLPKEHNWWGPAGVTGPCGPDTEMFIITKKPCGPDCSPACDCGAYLEIWNDVFMQYNKQKDGTFDPLTQKNVDTGMGLERTICVLNGKKSVYETDAFTGILAKIEELCGKNYSEDQTHPRLPHRSGSYAHLYLHYRRSARHRPQQRGSGLYPAPPDPPRRALRHGSGPARNAWPPLNCQGHHRSAGGPSCWSS
ncbi:MAG: alanine--tRNA ligase-related protein [Christensenellales bacterium]